MDALTLLLERRSSHKLSPPAPEGEALEKIFQAALRVPDFQRLRPYEFICASGEGLNQLGGLLEEAAIVAGEPEATIARARRMPQRAPLIRDHRCQAPHKRRCHAAGAATQRGLCSHGDADGRHCSRLRRRLEIRVVYVQPASS